MANRGHLSPAAVACPDDATMRRLQCFMSKGLQNVGSMAELVGYCVVRGGISMTENVLEELNEMLCDFDFLDGR